MSTPESQLTPEREMSPDELIDFVGREYRVPKGLRQSLFKRESGGQQYNPDGSVKVAKYAPYAKAGRGMGQLIPGTAKGLGVNPDDPVENVVGSMHYLKSLYDQAKPNSTDDAEAWAKAAAGYFSGPGNMGKQPGQVFVEDRSDGRVKVSEYVTGVMSGWADYDGPDNDWEDEAPKVTGVVSAEGERPEDFADLAPRNAAPPAPALERPALRRSTPAQRAQAESQGGAAYRIPVGTDPSDDDVKTAAAYLAERISVPPDFIEKWVRERGAGVYERGSGKALPSSESGFVTVPAEFVGQLRKDYEASLSLPRRALNAVTDPNKKPVETLTDLGSAAWEANTAVNRALGVEGAQRAIEVADVLGRNTNPGEIGRYLKDPVGHARAVAQGVREAATGQPVNPEVENQGAIAVRQAIGPEHPYLAAGAEMVVKGLTDPTNALPLERIGKVARPGLITGIAPTERTARMSHLDMPDVPVTTPEGYRIVKRGAEAAPEPKPVSEARSAQPAATTETIIKHSDPRIDGGRVIGQTADGRLKVQNNEGGVSVVKHPRRGGNREAAIVRREVAGVDDNVPGDGAVLPESGLSPQARRLPQEQAQALTEGAAPEVRAVNPATQTGAAESGLSARAVQPPERGLTRNFRAGNNDATLRFSSPEQRDLYDLGAKESYSMKGGQSRASQRAVGDIEGLRSSLAARLNLPESEVTRLASETLADVRSQMKGVKHLETRAVADNVRPAQPIAAPSPSRLDAAVPGPRAFRAQMWSKFNLSDQQADAVLELTEARARAWAKEAPGRSPDDYYAERFAGIERGGEAGPGALNQAANDAPTFYSQAQRVVSGIAQERMQPRQLQAMLDKGGVKAEELKWTGLDDYLAQKAARGEAVTKSEVLAHLKENEVRVEEVVKGEPDDAEIAAWWNDEGGANEETPFDSLSASERAAAIERYQDEVGQYEEGGTHTKFSQYTLPGAAEGSYRELLLTLPAKKNDTLNAYVKQRTRGEYDDFNKLERELPNLAERVRGEYEMRSGDEQPNPYKSSHYDEPNILAHVRFNERTDAEGKRVLFVEEIQSDWHQAGRKKGYKGEGVDEAKFRQWFEKNRADDDVTFEQYQRLPASEQRAYLDAYVGERDAATDIPDAPFKKTWHELAFKRILKHAAENGYDRVAWTKGETQAERYDLRKHVDSIDWVKDADDSYSILAAKDSQRVLRKQGQTPADLENLIGKELAQRIVDDAATGKGHGTLTGDSLKVGGEGMKGFYDRILPSYAQKYGKKWGARVGESKIPNGLPGTPAYVDGRWGAGGQWFKTKAEAETFVRQKNATPVHSIDITDSMRRSVMTEGQPLFQSNKAAVEFMSDSRAVLRAFQKADVSSAVHELAHVFRRDLSPDLLRDAEEAIGVKAGKWAKEHEERFARGFERYLKTGEAPTVKLRRVYENFKTWLTEIYGAVRGKNHPLSFKPNEKLVAVFDRMLGGEPKGEFGQLIHQLHKAPDEGTPAFFENAQVKRALGLKPDASTTDVRFALAEAVGRPRSSHLSPDDVRAWAESKNLGGAAKVALDDAIGKAEGKKAQVKEPWQMGREEYLSWLNGRAAAGHAEALEKYRRRLGGDLKDDYGEGFFRTPEEREANLRENIARLEAKKPEQFTYDRQTDFGRRMEVEKALKEGKDVPAEVLKDYPDLAEKYAAPDVPTTVDSLLDSNLKLVEDFYEGRVDESRFIREAKAAGVSRAEIRSLVSDARDYRKSKADSGKGAPGGGEGQTGRGRGGERVGQGDVKKGRRPADANTLYQSAEPLPDEARIADAERQYPLAGETVDGRRVRPHVPNMDSISATFDDYEVLPGIREVPMSVFSGQYERTRRTLQLAEEIKESGELNPLIVAIDAEGPYILEGGHRFDALGINGAKSIPAVVVVEKGVGADILYQSAPSPIAQRARAAAQKAARRPTLREQVADIANAPRSLKSSIDLSAAMRQGAMFTLTHPAKATKIFFGRQLRSLSNKGYEDFVKTLKADPDAALMRDSGLHLSTLKGDSVDVREEAFLSKIAEKVPLVKRSEQAYTTFLDSARAEWFKQLKTQAEDAAKKAGRNVKPEEYKAIADFVNIATGRGNLGKGKLNQAAPLLNSVFFAPRYVASKVQVFDPRVYAKLPEGSRRMALRQAVQYFGTIAATAALLKYGMNVEVGTDPESSDFLKAKSGDTRYDLTAGQGQYVTLAARLFRHFENRRTGQKEEFGGNAVKTLDRFSRYKYAPVPAAFRNTLEGKNAIGEPTSLTNELGELVSPIFLRELYDAYQKEGGAGVVKTSPSLVGIGVNTYGERRPADNTLGPRKRQSRGDALAPRRRTTRSATR